MSPFLSNEVLDAIAIPSEPLSGIGEPLKVGLLRPFGVWMKWMREMAKERLAGAIKVGFAQWRVDYTETVYRAFWPSSKGARRAGRPLSLVMV